MSLLNDHKNRCCIPNKIGSQKANELKDALEAETEKTAQMQEAMKKVDYEMKRSDELLSQMIPKAVADKVKKGLNPVDTCEVLSLYLYLNTKY